MFMILINLLQKKTTEPFFMYLYPQLQKGFSSQQRHQLYQLRVKVFLNTVPFIFTVTRIFKNYWKKPIFKLTYLFFVSLYLIYNLNMKHLSSTLIYVCGPLYLTQSSLTRENLSGYGTNMRPSSNLIGN